MPFKVVFMFNQFQRGWSEVYYSLGTGSPKGLFDSIVSDPVMLGIMAPRSVDTICFGVRISLIGQPRVSYSQEVGGKYVGARGAGIAGDRADVVSTDCVVRLLSAAAQSRKTFMRGLADSDIKRDLYGIDIFTPEFTGALSAYKRALTSAGLSMRAASRPPDRIAGWTFVRQLESAGQNSKLTLDQGKTTLLSVGSMISFVGIDRNDIPGFPRIMPVLAIDVTDPIHPTITVPYRNRSGTQAYIPDLLRFYPDVYTYPEITDLIPESFSERKTGRAFGVPRGRLPTAISRQ